jgi:hypothetical protein
MGAHARSHTTQRFQVTRLLGDADELYSALLGRDGESVGPLARAGEAPLAPQPQDAFAA